MSKEHIEKIVEDMKSNVPCVVMQAMLLGIDKKITDKRFIDAIKEHKNNRICLLNVPINYVAIAALDILGEEKYNGSDVYIMNMINEWK